MKRKPYDTRINVKLYSKDAEKAHKICKKSKTTLSNFIRGCISNLIAIKKP